MNKGMKGLFFGVAAGILDVIPMIMQGLPWDANLSAFLMCAASGFLISTSTLQIKPVIKGITISFLLLAPTAVLIFSKEPVSLIPVFIMTLLLGSVLGYLIEKY